MKKKRLIISNILAIILIISLCGCGPVSQAETQQLNDNATSYLSSWNSDGTVQDIIAFVETVTDETNQNYIPPEKRIAVWDMDGTLITEVRSDGVEITPETALLSECILRYKSDDAEAMASREAFISATEKLSAGEIDQYEWYNAYGDLRDSATEGLTSAEFIEMEESLIKDLEYEPGISFQDLAYYPMLELYQYLIENDFSVYMVSGSNRTSLYVIANYVLSSVGLSIPYDHCKGQTPVYDSSQTSTGEIIAKGETFEMSINLNKCQILAREIGIIPVLAIGNSSADTDMLNYALSNEDYKSLAVIINHDDSKREYAYKAEKMAELAAENNWSIVSMQNDFITLRTKE